MINRKKDAKIKTQNINIFLLLLTIFVSVGILYAILEVFNKTNSLQIKDYAVLLFYAFLFIINLTIMKFVYTLINSATKEIIDFYKQHPEYNDRKADFELYKGLAIIDNYILHPTAIVDVKKSTNFYLEYIPQSLTVAHNPYNSLCFKNEKGENKSISLNLLDELEINSLKSYLLRYGNELTIDPKNKSRNSTI